MKKFTRYEYLQTHIPGIVVKAQPPCPEPNGVRGGEDKRLLEQSDVGVRG